METKAGTTEIKVLHLELLAPLGIRNLHSVFGRGVRGETLAKGHGADTTLETVRGAGIRTIIDLRTADHSDRFAEKCDKAGLDYHHIPVDARNLGSGELHKTLPLLFSLLDGEGFYISCQQGLHRTDIALALYYFFHDSRSMPMMVGHRTKGVFRCDDIMRRVNSIRPLFPEIAEEDFMARRKRFLCDNRNFDLENTHERR